METIMLQPATLSPVLFRPNETTTYHAFGDVIHFYLTGAETEGKLTAFISVTPAEGGPPPHYHANEDEWFCPLEGEAEFFIEGVWHSVPQYSLIFAPRGSVHTFRNVGETSLKILTQTSPSGFENFIKQTATVFAATGAPDGHEIERIASEHGIYFVG
jgi:mannose-6-phosphate isomerase-like protein (cupin superfamily)